MKYFCFFILLLNSTLGSAELTILPESGKVVIEAKDCKEATALVQEFANSQCGKKKSSGWFSQSCKYDVTLCLADIFRELHGVKALVNGLNSWNLALFATGVVPVLRYVSPQEFKFFLKSPLCHELKSSEPSLSKDILVVRDKEGDEVQAAAFASESLVFTKKSGKTLDPYSLQKKTDFLERFHVNAEENHFERFRCENFDQYVSKLKTLPEKLLLSHRELTIIEKNIAHVLPVKVTLTEKEVQELKAKIQLVLTNYKSLSAEKNQSEDFQFLNASLKQRLIGIAEHFKENSKSVSPSEVEIKKPMIDMIETAFGLETKIVPKGDKSQDFDPSRD